MVGAYGDDDGGTNKGAVYLFAKISGSSWQETIKISDNGGGAGKLDVNLDSGDSFGSAATLDGNTLVIGAVGDDGDESDTGAVYLFNTSTLSYQRQSNNNCAATAPANATSYTGTIQLDAADDDQYYCFWAEDVAGNTESAVTDQINSV